MSEANEVDGLVMCIDDRYFDGDPASPELTNVSFVDCNGNVLCRMEFFADQECEAIYSAVLRYAERLGIEQKSSSNANNHFYT